MEVFMGWDNQNRREFLKKAGVAAGAAAAGGTLACTADPSQGARRDEPWFNLKLEISGLWFLALTGDKMQALAFKPGANCPGIPAQTGPVHFPCLFIHKMHDPKGGQQDNENPDYVRFNIKESISWPNSVRKSTDAPTLPKNVTNVAALADAEFNTDLLQCADVYQIPLNFGKPELDFPTINGKDILFSYERELGGDCGLGANVPLAWKLTYRTTVDGSNLDLKFRGGPTQPLNVPDRELKLIIRNTTEKHCHANDPTEDDDLNAKHYLNHYNFLKSTISADKRCYPVRTSKTSPKIAVSGLYTCMFGGGGS